MTLCGACPWRRDSRRDREMAESFLHLMGKVPEQRCSKYDQICVGWLQFARNTNLHIVLDDPEICAMISAQGRDEEDVFAGFHEFLRYHRGETFGSEEWWVEKQKVIQGPSYRFDEKTGQGSLF